MTEKYTKTFFIKELAARANFTQGDVKILWEEFEKLVEEIVAERSELMIGGLFKVYAKKINPHKLYDLNKKEYINIGTTYRLSIKPSSILRNAARYGMTQYENPPNREEIKED